MMYQVLSAAFVALGDGMRGEECWIIGGCELLVFLPDHRC